MRADVLLVLESIHSKRSFHEEVSRRTRSDAYASDSRTRDRLLRRVSVRQRRREEYRPLDCCGAIRCRCVDGNMHLKAGEAKSGESQ